MEPEGIVLIRKRFKAGKVQIVDKPGNKREVIVNRVTNIVGTKPEIQKKEEQQQSGNH